MKFNAERNLVDKRFPWSHQKGHEISMHLSLILHIMDLPEPLHDFLLVFLGSCLVLGSLGVVCFTNPIFSAFSLGLVHQLALLWCKPLGVIIHQVAP
ncbi:hypothetical protein HN51_042385 [Arachis hypogaea]